MVKIAQWLQSKAWGKFVTQKRVKAKKKKKKRIHEERLKTTLIRRNKPINK